jgi:hypothetical protein
MSFEEFWVSSAALGMPADDASRAMAVSAWDAALCAAQDAAFAHGKMQSAETITAALSQLHSWSKPAPSLS